MSVVFPLWIARSRMYSELRDAEVDIDIQVNYMEAPATIGEPD